MFFFWHRVGNGVLTMLSNMFTNLNLTDIEAGYKVFRRKSVQAIEIEENRFGFEPEIVAKIKVTLRERRSDGRTASVRFGAS